MKCERARRWLPLVAGDDLPEERARTVAAHLEECERCRALEQDLARSRRWLESMPAPPFTESDYAGLRRRVFREIEARGLTAGGASPRTGRLAFAGAGLLAAALAALLLARRAPEKLRVPAASPAAPSAVSAAAETLPPAAEPLAPAPSAASASIRPARGQRRAGAPGREQGVARIEFSTADPNVRIIWLVKKGDETSSALTAGRNREVS